MKRKWQWTILALALIAGGSYALYLYLRPVPLPEQVLYGNGHIEGTEIRISAEVSGLVVESALVEGASIEAGSMLVRIDPRELELERSRAEAEIAAIEQQGRRISEELRSWRHHLGTAESDFERYRELQDRGTVSPRRLEEVENALEETRGRVGTLEAESREFAARVDAARFTLALVETNLAKTRIASPIDATILVKAVEPGEHVRPGQTVAVLVDMSQLELTVFIPERDIGKIKLGDAAQVRVDAFAERDFGGTVTHVDQSAQFTPRDIHMPEERVRMVFGVTLALENADGNLKPGMPADAWILWMPAANWPEHLFVPQ